MIGFAKKKCNSEFISCQYLLINTLSKAQGWKGSCYEDEWWGDTDWFHFSSSSHISPGKGRCLQNLEKLFLQLLNKKVSGILMWIVYWYFIDFFFLFQPRILKFLDFYSVPYSCFSFSQPRWRCLKTTRFFTVTIWGLINSISRVPSHFCYTMLHNYWFWCSDDFRADETNMNFSFF